MKKFGSGSGYGMDQQNPDKDELNGGKSVSIANSNQKDDLLIPGKGINPNESQIVIDRTTPMFISEQNYNTTSNKKKTNKGIIALR